MRPVTLSFVLLLAGCASGGNTASRDNSTAVVGTTLRLRTSDGAKVTNVKGSIADVWRVLPEVFDSLGIPLTDVDAQTHVIQNSGMKAYKRLGSEALGSYIDCGSTQGFKSADTYDIRLSVITQADSVGPTASTVATVIEAVGRPMAFGGEYTRCSTTGELEKRIGKSVVKLVTY